MPLFSFVHYSRHAIADILMRRDATDCRAMFIVYDDAAASLLCAAATLILFRCDFASPLITTTMIISQHADDARCDACRQRLRVDV